MYLRAEFISLRSIPPGCDLQRQSTETAACEKKEKKKNWFYRIKWGVCERDEQRWTIIQSEIEIEGVQERERENERVHV